MRWANIVWVLLALGCSKSPEQTIVGVWRGTLSNAPVDKITEFAPTLELKPDGTYRMKVIVMDAEGTWNVRQGRSIVCTPATIEGMPAEEFAQKNANSPMKVNPDLLGTLTFALSEDRQTLTLEGSSKEQLIFRRGE